ncbi:hypothetical protein FZW96_15035 [Bacillus sp. BGMRC 2118]|nr:hypothetical protein FZW96_15035 [Bacillus sp. BGMRC 2118]
MNVKVTIIPDEHDTSSILLNEVTAKRLGIGEYEEIQLTFGTASTKVKLTVSQNIAQEVIGLSQHCIKLLNLPLCPYFELQYQNDNIIIGPFIAILAAKTHERLQRKLKKLLYYVQHYDQFYGAVLAFSLDSINKNEQLISGYMYNPVTHSWEYGVFPYPQSIYRKVTLKKSWRNHFEKQIGTKIFNYKNLSKWTLHQLLEEYEEIKSYLPYTTLYREPEDVLSYLENKGMAFIKPISGLKGKNIIQVEKVENGFAIQYRTDNENYFIILSKEEFIHYLSQHIRAERFIIQEKLHLTFEDDRVIDFRLFVTKDDTNTWKCLGWVGRSGIPRSIVSNRSSGGIVENGDDTLKRILKLTDDEVPKWKEKIFQAACKASLCFDKEGMNFGYFAIDIGIDRNQNIWILEMNHRSPNDGLPLYIGDQQLYEQIKLSNMLYLKYLAGFS